METNKETQQEIGQSQVDTIPEALVNKVSIANSRPEKAANPICYKNYWQWNNPHAQSVHGVQQKWRETLMILSYQMGRTPQCLARAAAWRIYRK
jgi:hypothetical protein